MSIGCSMKWMRNGDSVGIRLSYIVKRENGGVSEEWMSLHGGCVGGKMGLGSSNGE